MIGREGRNPAEGGIGGTGIVGLVTDFSSLIVNGLKVETTPATAFTTALGRTSEAAIARGDALTIEASTRGGRLFADRAHVTHPVIGQVLGVTTDGLIAFVSGIRVFLEPQTQGRVQFGDRIAVSGLWRGGDVVASRIARVDTDQDVIAGEARIVNGILFIGDLPIRPMGFGAPVASGQFATVYGRYSNGAMTPSRLVPGRFVGASGDLGRLSIEGYLAPSDTAPGFRVAGLGHSFARDINLAPFAAQRTLFEGDYSGLFAADRALSLPDDFEARRALLKTRLGDAYSLSWQAIT